jgi:hypothetical protein
VTREGKLWILDFGLWIGARRSLMVNFVSEKGQALIIDI